MHELRTGRTKGSAGTAFNGAAPYSPIFFFFFLPNSLQYCIVWLGCKEGTILSLFLDCDSFFFFMLLHFLFLAIPK